MAGLQIFFLECQMISMIDYSFPDEVVMKIYLWVRHGLKGTSYVRAFAFDKGTALGSVSTPVSLSQPSFSFSLSNVLHSFTLLTTLTL
jgi:hypothetical protein